MPTGVWPQPDLEAPFIDLCQDAWAATRALIAAAHDQQSTRSTRARHSGDPR